MNNTQYCIVGLLDNMKNVYYLSLFNFIYKMRHYTVYNS